jgi:hypothetical protein
MISAIQMRRLFLAALFAAALLTKTDPESAHEFSRLGTVESLVERGTYQLDGSTFIDTVDKIYYDGHFYSHQPPLLATLEAPAYLVIRTPGIRFNNRGRRVATYLFSLFTNGLALALTAVVFARIFALCAGGLKSSPTSGGVAALLLTLGTWLLPYGTVANNHGISGLLLALLIWLLLLIEWHGATRGRIAATGIVLGLLCAIEILPLLSFAPLTMIYLAMRPDVRGRALATLVAAFAAPLVAHAAINIRITGDVIPAGFHQELFRYPGSVFTPESLSGTVKFQSAGELARYVWESLFAGKGFFTFAPLLLLGLVAAFANWQWWSRARGVHLVLLGGIVLSLGASLLTTNNFGGEAVGFRHAVYLAPAFVVFLVPWLTGSAASRRVVLTAACVSMLLMLTFAVRKPWSVMTLETRPIGTWDQYVPIVARVIRGDLLRP